MAMVTLPLIGSSQPANPETERLERLRDAEKALMQRELESMRRGWSVGSDSPVLKLLQSPAFGEWKLVPGGVPEPILLTRSLGAQENSEFELLSFRLMQTNREWGTISCITAPCPGLYNEAYLVVSDLKLVQVSCNESWSRAYWSNDKSHFSARSPREIVERMYRTINSWREGSLASRSASAEDLAVCESR